MKGELTMSRRRNLVPEASAGLNRFKMEVAQEMGLDAFENRNISMADTPTNVVGRMKNAGNVGGEMVKRMVASFEQQLIDKK